MATILIVEDDPTIGTLLQEIIQRKLGSRVLWTTCASDALREVEHNAPDLILLDYFLPDMNGIELYDHLQNMLKKKHIPTIMLSAALSSIVQQMQERHISGMSKPFHIGELTILMKKMMPVDVS